MAKNCAMRQKLSYKAHKQASNSYKFVQILPVSKRVLFEALIFGLEIDKKISGLAVWRIGAQIFR